MVTIEGTLSGTDNRDKCSYQLEEGEYTYNLSAGGKGRVGLKIRTKNFQIEGKKIRTWKTIVEKKSKIRGGTSLQGSFTVGAGLDISENSVVEFIFTRPAGGRKVTYDFTCTRD